MFRNLLRRSSFKSRGVYVIQRCFAARANKPLKFLVIDGYTKDGRADLQAGGASTAGELYRTMFDRSSPVGATSDIVYPCDPDFPSDIRDINTDEYDGVGWTGCSLTIYSGEERVNKQIDLAKEFYKRGIPQFGSCWSIQIAAVAAGGVCAKNPRGREMGFARKITLNSTGRAHPMYIGKPSVFDAFISHEDEISHAPPTGQVLCSNDWTAIQGMSVKHGKGEFWAVQYHPEYDLKELARLTYCRINKLIGMGFFQNRADAETYVNELETLHKDPTRKDLWWKHGISGDILNPDVRTVEVRNWIQHLVLPYNRLK